MKFDKQLLENKRNDSLSLIFNSIRRLVRFFQISQISLKDYNFCRRQNEISLLAVNELEERKSMLEKVNDQTIQRISKEYQFLPNNSHFAMKWALKCYTSKMGSTQAIPFNMN